MENKEEVLQYIKTIAEQKIVSRDELIDTYDMGSGAKKEAISRKRLDMAQILYYIGGGIVFLGIFILIWQNWSSLMFGTKVIATFGAGIAAYFIGLLFSRNEKTEKASPAFYLIFSLVTPIGLSVIFDNAGFDAGSYGVQSLISGIMLVSLLLSLTIFRKNFFILFSILFGTWLFFSLTSLMVESALSSDDWEFYMYRIFVVGVTYILMGYSFSKDKRDSLCGFLYGFGIFGVLGAALALGKWYPGQNPFWELIYPGLVFAALFLSVHLKSKAFLVWGTFFLMVYIFKITSEYFSTGLGWPLALVIAGLFMIGAGYMFISIKKKYLSAE
ncbi:MAG: hypothetical protein PHW52_00270 [Candidatus Pacebacteria bacterium]|nr:hypothetical protein [Candidatus Paceibacterota bacterium]